MCLDKFNIKLVNTRENVVIRCEMGYHQPSKNKHVCERVRACTHASLLTHDCNAYIQEFGEGDMGYEQLSALAERIGNVPR